MQPKCAMPIVDDTKISDFSATFDKNCKSLQPVDENLSVWIWPTIQSFLSSNNSIYFESHTYLTKYPDSPIVSLL